LDFENLDLPFDLAQGGELVEPFRISTRLPRLARMAGRYSDFGFQDLGKKYPCFPSGSLIFLGSVDG